MGIRINRRVGFGLELSSEQDVRVNWDAIQFEKLEAFPNERYQARVEDWCGTHPGWEQMSFWHGLLAPEKPAKFYECVNMLGSEASLPSPVLLIIPPDMVPIARQQDNLIDFVDYQLNQPEKFQERVGMVQQMAEVPYPYRRLVVDRETLVPASHPELLHLLEGERQDMMVAVDKVLAGSPFGSLEEARERSLVLPPPAVFLTAFALDVFHAVETAWELKPMLVTTWE